MARGWESKSVEEQMANASQQPEVKSGNGYVSEEQRRLAEQKRAEKTRQMQSLNLQRENILSQRTSNPARRAALEDALSHVEAQIAALN
ncbi:MAG: hypothetical protein KGM96_16015 [Acidobacteriota bacterium]|nr:hypothetical protein [Acidobacteriota bacterium]